MVGIDDGEEDLESFFLPVTRGDVLDVDVTCLFETFPDVLADSSKGLRIVSRGVAETREVAAEERIGVGDSKSTSSASVPKFCVSSMSPIPPSCSCDEPLPTECFLGGLSVVGKENDG